MQFYDFAFDWIFFQETLSDLGYIHKSLNASHIIIDPATKQFKIVDSELAKDYGIVVEDNILHFSAPETLRDQSFTLRSDIWSFGCLLWQIVRFGKFRATLDHIVADAVIVLVAVNKVRL